MERLSDPLASYSVLAVKDLPAAAHNTVQNITAGDSARVHNGHNFQTKFVISRSNTLDRDVTLNWLSTLCFTKAHERVREGASLDDQSQIASPTRYPGKWLLESQLFVDWVTGDNDKLWYIGMPGAGKSVLASIIIEHLRLRKVQHSEDSSEQVACLYLSYNEPQSTESLLGSVIRQLVQHSEVMPQAVRDLWQLRSRGKEPPTLRDLTELLNIIHQDLEKPNYVVVDALDECPAKIRLRLIKALQPKSGNLKILVTSRQMDEFQDVQKEFCIKAIEAHQDDLDFFMDTEMHRTPAQKEIWDGNPALRASVKSAVNRGCAKMFLLASLQMEYIVSSLRESDVRDKLKKLPTDADELYQKTLDRIDKLDETKKKLALDILTWIVFSFRPLSIEELRHALAVKPGQSKFDVERLYNANVIRDVCCGLVSVSVHKENVTFAHYTAHTFFNRLLKSRFPGFHSTVSLTLITYLSLDIFEQPDNINDCVSYAENHSRNYSIKSMRDLQELGYLDGRKKLGFDAKLWWFPLLRYAADYLGYHIRQQHDPVLRDSVVSSLEILLRSRPKRRFLVRLSMHPYRHLRVPRLSITSGDNFRENYEPNDRDSDASTTLSRYTAEHAAELLEKLLDDDDNDEENGHSSSPPTSLSASEDVLDEIHSPKKNRTSRALIPAQSHAIEVVGDMENASDDALHEIDSRNGSSMHTSAQTPSHTRVVAGGIGGLVTTPDTTAIHVACYLGWKPLVERLLERSELLSEINQLNEDGMTPVNYAVVGAFWDIVNVLVANGVSIDLAAKEGHSILLHAARSDQSDLVGRVISQQLREDQAISGWAMVQKAGRTRLRHLRRSLWNLLTQCAPSQIMRREKTAAVTQATRDHHLRLLLAALNGDAALVRQLLPNGHVDLKNQSSHFHETALFLAVEFGHVDVVTELVDGGADVDMRGIDGCTPLHRATARNDVQMVQTLLGKKASVTMRDNRGETAWLANAQRGHEEVLHILESFGAGPNTKCTDGVTRLYEAAAGGHFFTVNFLLERGVNPSILTAFGWAPLHWAAHNGHLDCVWVLLAHGANPSPISDQSTTPLDMARRANHHAVANMLRDAGAKTAQEVLQSTERYAQRSYMSIQPYEKGLRQAETADLDGENVRGSSDEGQETGEDEAGGSIIDVPFDSSMLSALRRFLRDCNRTVERSKSQLVTEKDMRRILRALLSNLGDLDEEDLRKLGEDACAEAKQTISDLQAKLDLLEGHDV